jgi:CRP/FNR family transcriptional activator FtrB
MEHAERSGWCAFSLPCEKSVLAGYLGMTPESLSRSFRVLRDHGVAVDGTKIHVTDGAALRGFLDRVR